MHVPESFFNKTAGLQLFFATYTRECRLRDALVLQIGELLMA